MSESIPRDGGPQDLDGELAALLRQGEKIEAIKVYRQATGYGLAEAKQAVERLEQQLSSADAPPPDATGLEDQLLPLLKEGRKIEAIKVYRQATGSGLFDAKQAVEEIVARHRILVRGRGCAGAVLLGGLALLGGWALWAAGV